MGIITAITSAITGIFSILADHGYRWILKLIGLSLLLAAYVKFSQEYAMDTQFTPWAQYEWSMFATHLFSYDTIKFIYDCFIFFTTLELFFWISGASKPSQPSSPPPR